MKGTRPATRFLACWIVAAGVASAQTIDLSSPLGRRMLNGGVAGARFGTALHSGDLTGDFDNKELIIGSPDAGTGVVRIYQRVSSSTPSLFATVTGEANGDRFGATADAGFVFNVEIPLVHGRPPSGTPTPPRDLIVGAPGAAGGRGAVYVFAGPFVSNGNRTASAASVRVMGAAPGDALGSIIESGDLNGDGYRELILAVPARGIIYVVDVHNAPTSTIDLAVAVPGTIVTGLGNDIDIATGDVNNDGIFDLAIGNPTWNSGTGRVHLWLGGQALPATRTLASIAPQIGGTDPGDYLGDSLWISDIDDDNDDAMELIIGVPGADGINNGRPDAGEVVVVWGRPDIAAAFVPGLRLIGAAPNHRLGKVVTAGDITRDSPDDIAMLAPAGNGGAGEIYVYYGRHDYDFPSGPVDLSTGSDRLLISDESAGRIQTIRVWEATFEGAEEILVGVPEASTTAGPASGSIFIPLSPRMDISPTSLNLRVMQGVTTQAPITIDNISAVPVTYGLIGGGSWFSVSPPSGTVSVSAGATLTVSINGAALTTGELTGNFSIRSNTRDLAMTVPISLRVWVLARPTLTSNVVSHIDIGQTVTWTATADTSAGPVEYLFRRYSATRGWETVRDWSTTNTYTWTPSSTDSGRYAIEVHVRVVGSTAAYETMTSTGYYTVGNDAPLFVFSGHADFDGDRRADPSVFRPSNGTWYALRSASQFGSSWSRNWGLGTDVPVPGDYDGDAKTDLAVYRPSNGVWYMLLSRTGYTVSQTKAWGVGTDIPVPGDYDGDRRTDVAVFRPADGTWYVRYSSRQYADGFVRAWGISTDIPVPGDYDGDGKTDLAVYRPSTGTWYVLESITRFAAGVSYRWGIATDRPVPADYDGDRRTDLAVFRPSNGQWYLLYSSTGYTAGPTSRWGTATDLPVPGDYDADGRADVAVFRPESGVWLVMNRFSVNWGIGTDIPLLRK